MVRTRHSKFKRGIALILTTFERRAVIFLDIGKNIYYISVRNEEHLNLTEEMDGLCGCGRRWNRIKHPECSTLWRCLFGTLEGFGLLSSTWFMIRLSFDDGKLSFYQTADILKSCRTILVTIGPPSKLVFSVIQVKLFNTTRRGNIKFSWLPKRGIRRTSVRNWRLLFSLRRWSKRWMATATVTRRSQAFINTFLRKVLWHDTISIEELQLKLK